MSMVARNMKQPCTQLFEATGHLRVNWRLPAKLI
jgi:hypothetical protein